MKIKKIIGFCIEYNLAKNEDEIVKITKEYRHSCDRSYRAKIVHFLKDGERDNIYDTDYDLPSAEEYDFTSEGEFIGKH
jgi:hypothetical protein